jgi:Lar family restriction alleviation protein
MNEKLKKAILLLEEYEYEHAYDVDVCVQVELDEIKKKVGWVELKPCPHCGKLDTVWVGNRNKISGTKSDGQRIAVNCNRQIGGCGATGGYFDTEKEAVEAWNRRA